MSLGTGGTPVCLGLDDSGYFCCWEFFTPFPVKQGPRGIYEVTGQINSYLVVLTPKPGFRSGKVGNRQLLTLSFNFLLTLKNFGSHLSFITIIDFSTIDRFWGKKDYLHVNQVDHLHLY